MIEIGRVVPYLDICREEGVNLQRGMNFHLGGKYSVILMSLRANAPYADRIEENGKVLIYEGHDAPKQDSITNPKIVDQPMLTPKGKCTQNSLFYEAAMRYKNSQCHPELVKVYEKIHSGIWVYNGVFKLVDSWQEIISERKVFKFKLEMMGFSEISTAEVVSIEHNRLIPTSVKLEVWKRDKGQCVICGSKDNLHFDHILPYSKGGSSLVAENIQLLCARHNLAKRDKIE
ncbi:MAG: HNH endonuclease [Chloroflexota bacterium]